MMRSRWMARLGLASSSLLVLQAAACVNPPASEGAVVFTGILSSLIQVAGFFFTLQALA